MKLRDWERDVINRQRNIVFPDTVLNEGRFYRNIVYENAIHTLGQRISLLLIVLGSILIFVVALFAGISDFQVEDSTHVRRMDHLAICLYPLGVMLFWIFVAVNGFLSSPSRPRKRRRGYRQSHRI